MSKGPRWRWLMPILLPVFLARPLFARWPELVVGRRHQPAPGDVQLCRDCGQPGGEYSPAALLFSAQNVGRVDGHLCFCRPVLVGAGQLFADGAGVCRFAPLVWPRQRHDWVSGNGRFGLSALCMARNCACMPFYRWCTCCCCGSPGRLAWVRLPGGHGWRWARWSGWRCTCTTIHSFCCFCERVAVV